MREDLTLENVQVDCTNLTEEQVKEMSDVFEKNGFDVDLDGITDEHFYLRLAKCGGSVDLFRLDDTKTTITYDKFMELFGEKEESEEILTLDSIQVDCSELTEGQIKEMCNVYKSNGYKQWMNKDALKIEDNYTYLRIDWENEFCMNGKSSFKTIITYDKFMELFGENDKLPPYKEAPLKWNYGSLVGGVIKGIETIDEVSPISSREKELKKTLKYLLKKDIILTPKQYKKLWKGN